MKSLPTKTVRGPSPCVWMQAGAIRKKNCAMAYRCHECKFDRVLRQAARENYRRRDLGEPAPGKRGTLVFWKDKLRELPSWKQPCIHHMKGSIDFRACTHAYHCGDCEFNQFFQDQLAVHTLLKPVDFLTTRGVSIPQGYYLDPGHVWLSVEEEGSARIGLDDFARRVLGPLDAIESPLPGKTITRHQPALRAFRKGVHADFSAPVSGVVTDINPEVRTRGWQAHADPYASGWVMRIHSDSLRKDLSSLMIGGESRDYLDQEVGRLFGVIEAVAGPLAADGGYLGEDIFGNMPQLGWERLCRSFFEQRG